MKYRKATIRLSSALPLMIVVLIASQDVSAREPSAREAAKPNIIIIMADDLGYGDTSVYNGWVKTPRLERMASEGLTFTDFHANSSVCSPTRAAFMTGRYQQRVGIVDVIVGHRDTHGLSPEELTIPRLMKQAGYKTALFGKWHLGEPTEFAPSTKSCWKKWTRASARFSIRSIAVVLRRTHSSSFSPIMARPIISSTNIPSVQTK